MTSYPDPGVLNDLIELSRWVGEPSRDLVLLAEGNTSIKVGGGLLVKASGASLENAEESDFVDVERAPLERMIEAGTANDAEIAETMRTATRWGERRPSVETLLHVVCQQYETVSTVIHTHPVVVNSLLCSSRADHLVRGSYFPDQIVTLGRHNLLIPYVDPGLKLAHVALGMVRDHFTEHEAVPKVIYLANHGMFALGGSTAEAKQITLMAVKTARVVLGALSAGDPVLLSEQNVDRIHTRPDEIFRRALLAGGDDA